MSEMASVLYELSLTSSYNAYLDLVTLQGDNGRRVFSQNTVSRALPSLAEVTAYRHGAGFLDDYVVVNV